MKLSVCMATYNGESYIKEQLDSILVQLSDDDEFIISDDSSSDNTIKIIKSYKDMRIRLYENQEFKSPIYNFENALKYAVGDYIFLSDQDDIWKSNKVEVMKKYLKSYDLVMSDAYIVDKDGIVLIESFFKVNNSKKGLLNNIYKNSYVGCTMAFNRKILEKSLPFPKDIVMHDWWIGLIAEYYGKTNFIDDKLMNYRRHENNISSSTEMSKNNLLKKITMRIIMIKNLLLSSINV